MFKGYQFGILNNFPNPVGLKETLAPSFKQQAWLWGCGTQHILIICDIYYSHICVYVVQILSPMVNYHAVPWHVKETYHSIKSSMYFPAGVKDHAGNGNFFLLSRHLKMWFSWSLEPKRSLSFLPLCGDVTGHGHAGPLFPLEVWKSFPLCVDLPFDRLDSG